MAKELFILFVYDTQLCQREEDDPQDAVLYFYPAWVTDQQRLALCGQLMGATQFYLTAFSCPRILSLNSGKFAIKQYGRYIVAVGTDRNVPDWIIDHRANTLHHLLQLYHQDLETISKCTNSMGTPFKDKLSQIFETFLPILQYAVDVFGTIPTIRLPKSASNVFLEAIQILHCCQEMKGVLGGVVLYQNRVVATQLCAGLTKSLVSTDPYRIKSPAENVSTPFHLPIGVQLLEVYIEHKEFAKLSQEATSARSSFEGIAKRKDAEKRVETATCKAAHISKEIFGSMKRDISRIFTVPEEMEIELSELDVPLSNAGNHKKEECLNYRSQCTTPLKDVNLSKVLHERVVSICRVSESEEGDVEDRVMPDLVTTESKLQPIADDSHKSKGTPNFLINFSENTVRRCQSLPEIIPRRKLSSNRVPIRYYSFGLPRLTRELLGEELVDDQEEDDRTTGRHYYNTITDSCYPVFRSDGLPISRSLFEQHLLQHYHMLDNEKNVPFSLSVSKEKPPVKNLPFINAGSSLRSNLPVQSITETETPKPSESAITPKETPTKQELYRRSLSLPLKNLTSESNGEDLRSYPGGVPESPTVRTRVMGSLPLTPLMAKLSSLALEDKSSGFWSRDTTPCEFPAEDIPASSYNVPSKMSKPVEKIVEVVESESDKRAGKRPEKAVLYVFGQQSMVLLLLLEEESSIDPELIHSLWETSVSSLNRLESHLRQCLEHSTQCSDAESYSYICLDPRWDMMQRGGPWGCLELDLVASLHNHFKQSNSITETVVRCEDSTVYGYQCGKTEVFYHQASNATVGLPTPSDLMGVVPLKARRRLERDHGIVLL